MYVFELGVDHFLTDGIRIIKISDKVLAHVGIILEHTGFLLDQFSQHDHPLGELSVVDAIVDLLEAFSHLQPLSIELDHVLIALQHHDEGGEFIGKLLVLLLADVLLSDVGLDVLEEDVDLEVFEESAVVELAGKGILLYEFTQACLAAHYR
jgi:hypothetical protein